MVPEMSLRAKTQLNTNLQLAIRFKRGGHLTHPGGLRALSPTCIGLRKYYQLKAAHLKKQK